MNERKSDERLRRGIAILIDDVPHGREGFTGVGALRKRVHELLQRAIKHDEVLRGAPGHGRNHGEIQVIQTSNALRQLLAHAGEDYWATPECIDERELEEICAYGEKFYTQYEIGRDLMDHADKWGLHPMVMRRLTKHADDLATLISRWRHRHAAGPQPRNIFK